MLSTTAMAYTYIKYVVGWKGVAMFVPVRVRDARKVARILLYLDILWV